MRPYSFTEPPLETLQPEVAEVPVPTAEELQEQSEFFGEMDDAKLQEVTESLNQFTDHERDVYLRAVEAEPALTRDVQEICEETGSTPGGLEYRLKQPDSLLDKIHERDDPMEIDEIKDINRYTQLFRPEELAEGVNDSLARFEERGYQVEKISNTWDDPSYPYNGINVKLVSPDGVSMEMQYHTQESFELKNGEMHDLYREWQHLPPDSEEAIELNERMFELSDTLKRPPGVEGVRKK